MTRTSLQLASALLLMALAPPGQALQDGQVLEVESGVGVPTPGLVQGESLAHEEAVAALIELGREDPRVMDHLLYLTRWIGPRLTGSTGLDRASHWARERFESFGLEAWLEPWGEEAVGFDRGEQIGGMVAPDVIPYAFGSDAWTAGTAGPLRAPAVLAPSSLEDFDERVDSFEGAWVVALPRADAPKGRVRRELATALEDVAPAGYVRNAGKLILTGGRNNVTVDALPEVPRLKLLESHYEDLVVRLQAGEEVELEFDLDHRFRPGPIPQYNVVADLVGTEFPDEYVIVGGHLDSWDGAEGAQDNGTGVSTTLEAARLLAAVGVQPRRTIRFMLWGGEEQGLLGSSAWVEAHAAELERISAVLVHDGGGNYLSGIAGPKALVADLHAVFAPVVALDLELPFEVRENEGLSPRGASDHSSFVAKGVPGFFWRQSGELDYNHIHHTQHDHYEAARADYQEHSALVVAIGALGLANLDHLLDRTDLMNPNARGRRDPKRRLMGVFLDDTEVTSVMGGGLAEQAGWQEGDVILSIDGVEIAERGDINDVLQAGGPKKVVRLQRGETVVESVLDYTGTPSQLARDEEAAKLAQEAAAAGETTAGASDPTGAPAAGEAGEGADKGTEAAPEEAETPAGGRR